MTEFLQFLFRGLATGSLYVLVALGLVLIHRGSGVVNFAQGAMGMVGTFIWWELTTLHGVSFWPAAAAGVLVSALLGVVTHAGVIRRLRTDSPVTRAIATLAVLAILQSAAALRWPSELQIVNAFLPTGTYTLVGAPVGKDRIIVVALAVLLTLVLDLIYRRTKFGLATTAVAEHPRGAAALAISPNLVAVANWAIGAGLACVAGIMLAPLTGMSITGLTLLVVPALAAAVCGGLNSFPLTLLGGLAIGVAQSEVTNYWPSVSGLSGVVPFVIVAAVLLFRGARIAGRGEVGARLPAVGSGILRPVWLLVGAVIVLYFIWFGFDDLTWLDALTTSLMVAIIVLSVLVVTGYAGQLSLAQFAFAGLGALVAGQLVQRTGVPFLFALLIGAVAMLPVGLLVGFAGVRTRGVTLSIVTLSLAAALESVVFNNPSLTGGINGINITDLTLFGWQINSINYPQRYATLVLAFLILLSLMVANLRRGRVGRRLIAVRSNERAAASLGISVVASKLYAFALAGMIAAVGGVLLTFRDPVLNFTQFGAFRSIQMVQDAVVGGLGIIPGATVGATIDPGGFGTRVFQGVLGKDNNYIFLIGGILLLITLLQAPDGLAAQHIPGLNRLRRKPRQSPSSVLVTETADDPAGVISHRVSGKVLDIRDVSVHYGGVVALNGLSLQVHPGEIVGLIGPNGAGKTTAIDAITGFARSSGEISIGGEPVHGWNPVRRARAGLGRSFQSLELFDDLTVLENIKAACERRDLGAYATDLVWPGKPGLTTAALATIKAFNLEDSLDMKPTELSYGKRRLVGIARSIAAEPSVVLLDEPAAGLDENETRELGELIQRLATDWGIGVLLVEHDVALVMRICDKVHALDFGRTLAFGTPQEVRTNSAVVAAYLGTTRATAESESALQEPAPTVAGSTTGAS